MAGEFFGGARTENSSSLVRILSKLYQFDELRSQSIARRQITQRPPCYVAALNKVLTINWRAEKYRHKYEGLKLARLLEVALGEYIWLRSPSGL